MIEITHLMQAWWDSLTLIKQNNNLPARGTVSAALVVLDRLKSDFVLELDHHRAPGKSQIRGQTKTKVQKILASFGETRSFSSEGGRTNRGVPREIEKLLEALSNANLKDLSEGERLVFLEEAQRFLVTRVKDYFSRERIKVIFNPSHSGWQFVHDILETARAVGKEGNLAQYLVGAKLALRFPELEVRNAISSAQDVLTGDPGDFLVNDTVFHVTVSANQGHFEKCKTNLTQGFSVYLLVPERVLLGTRQNAENLVAGQITTQSIESFVSQNIEELSSFSKNQLAGGFRKLLDKYNNRVDQVEVDKSMLIEIPRNLQ